MECGRVGSGMGSWYLRMKRGKKGGEENKMIRNSLSLYVNTGDKEMNYIHRVLCRLILAQLKR